MARPAEAPLAVGKRVVLGEMWWPDVVTDPVYALARGPRDRIWRVGQFEPPGPIVAAQLEEVSSYGWQPADGNRSLVEKLWWEAFTLLEEIPWWRVYGERGATVAEILEQVGRIEAAAARAFAGAGDWINYDARLSHPPVVGTPDPLSPMAASRAVNDVGLAFAWRIEAVDPKAGFIEVLPHFSNLIEDPGWNGLCAVAQRAATTAVFGRWMDPESAVAWSAPWGEFLDPT